MKMKGITVEKVGAELKVADLPVPEPGEDQILVKSIFTAINPVYVNGIPTLRPSC